MYDGSQALFMIPYSVVSRETFTGVTLQEQYIVMYNDANKTYCLQTVSNVNSVALVSNKGN